MEEMGDRLRRLRTEHNLTQEEVGKYIGVQRSAINKYENGNVENIKRSTIAKLARLYHVSPTPLMALDDLDEQDQEPLVYSKPNKVETEQKIVSDFADDYMERNESDKQELTEHIGTTLKALREKQGMSQDQLADRLGIKKAAVSSYETGKRLPRTDTLYALARLFGVPTDAFFPPADSINLDNCNQIFGTNHGVNGNNSGTINFGVNESPTEYHTNRADDLTLQQSVTDSIAQISALNTQQVDQLNTIISILKERPY